MINKFKIKKTLLLWKCALEKSTTEEETL